MCDSCEVLNINGTNCHELGCPDAWKDYTLECKECGAEFKPTDSNQEHCTVQCYAIYNGLPYEEEVDDE